MTTWLIKSYGNPEDGTPYLERVSSQLYETEKEVLRIVERLEQISRYDGFDFVVVEGTHEGFSALPRFAFSTVVRSPETDFGHMSSRVETVGWAEIELLAPRLTSRDDAHDLWSLLDGLKVASFVSSLSLPDTTGNLPTFKEELAFAFELEAGRYTVPIDATFLDLSTPDAECKQLITELDESALFGHETYGIEVSVRPPAPDSVESQSAIDRLLASTEHLTLSLDLPRTAVSGEDALAFLKQRRGRLSSIRLKDWFPSTLESCDDDSQRILNSIAAWPFLGLIVVEQSRTETSLSKEAEHVSNILQRLGFDPRPAWRR